MSGVASDIGLGISHWFPGKTITALTRFDYHLGGTVVQRTRYIAVYCILNGSVHTHKKKKKKKKKKEQRNLLWTSTQETIGIQ